jgi:AcrR family transcriptional regulator
MPTTTKRPTKPSGERLSADERRDHVLDAAVAEFGERGYHAASTASIAKRAGISQPYIYALFADKRALFLAMHERVVARIEEAFLEAARGAASPEEALEAMGHAYRPLMEDPTNLRAQLQCYAAAAVAGFFACGMLINVALAIDLPELAEPLLHD